jgi:hypothetical protein
MRLIPDAALAWRFASVQAALLLTILTAVQADVVPMLQPLMDNATYLKVSAALSLLVIVLRVVAQPGLDRERQQLGMDSEAPPAQQRPGFDARGADVEGLVEGMAQTLYKASGSSKPWPNVSPESKERWRTVAAAALAWSHPGQDSADFVGEHF